MTDRKAGKGKTKKAPARNRRTAQPRYAAAAVMRSQVLELRTLGMTLEQIAAQVGRAKSVVHTHLRNALDELDAEQRDETDRLRALAYARLEKILARALLGALKGDVKCMREAQRLIAAQQRLMGWGAPAQINPETGEPIGDGTDAVAGHYTLPMRPVVDIAGWQAEAEAAWQRQQANEASE